MQNFGFHMSTNFSDDGRVITAFKETPLTPTYLFAFVLSDFTKNEDFNKNKILFRVFSRPEQFNNTQFGLTTAIQALDLYEEAFETKYELNKLDQMALPVFNRGGMENYGIVFYREDYLLVEDGVSKNGSIRIINIRP
jgi:aminopeptidase N